MRGVLFDFNGTLFFDSDKHIEAFRRIFAANGYPVPSDQTIVTEIFGRTNRQIFSERFSATATDTQLDLWGEQKEQFYRAACLSDNSLSLAPGAEALLDLLKEREIPYAVATGSGRSNVDFYFAHLGLDRWFSEDNLIWCDDSFPGKPAPDIYHRAAAALGLRASDCLIFEDGTSGLVSAFAAGAGAVCAIYERGLPDPLTPGMQPMHICHDFLRGEEILRMAGILS